jgi:heterodisulfide reductase subunit A
MINIIINKRKLKVEEGKTILEVAKKAGINIPTLCYHSALSPYGACRLCLVEIIGGGRPGLVASCQYPVQEGLIIETDTEKVHNTRKIMLELILARNPNSEKVKEIAKEYGIIKTRIEKKEKDECILCGLCVRICRERMGQNVLSFINRGYERKVGPAFDKKSPICMGCGACAFVCPTGAIKPEDFCEKDIMPLLSEFEEGIGTRPVINILYPQAVPNAPVIDKERCIYFNKEKCQICSVVCEADAIKYTMEEERKQLNVGAIIFSPGFDLFDAHLKGEYGYGIYKNVITSRQFERILSASGPFQGEIIRPSDGKHPKKIAFISCVGSRDCANGNEYCSSVCCMYSTKEAIIAKEHDPNIEVTIFYMDMRAFGKGFEYYFNNAKQFYGIRYIRCLPSKLVELQKSKNLRITYKAENNSFVEEEFDMVILATGITPSKKVKKLASNLNLDLNEYGFCLKSGFSPTQTKKPGIFVSGAFGEPKDIPETIIEASSAAAEASILLSQARGTLTISKKYPEEKPFVDEEPRIGVFVCHCGRNIGGVIDVPAVVEYARTLPYVVFADESLYTCSQDSLEKIKKEIHNHKLTRVVVASCTPTTHAPLFRETIREAGLNPYLFEMASIREHCSWVHMKEPEKATQKAKELVAMAVNKAALLSPIKQVAIELNKKGLIIGGGITGMTAALSLAEQGFDVYLIEKENKLGGHANNMYFTIDGKNIKEFLQKTINEIQKNEHIHIYLNAEVREISGYLGNYETIIYLKEEKKAIELHHGIIIVATGAKEYKPKEYLYNKNKKVITQTEFEKKLIEEDISNLKTIVMIQCVGSRNEEHSYCSRICCTHAIKNALKLKELKPDTQIVILYRDIRTYGFREKYYLEARKKGVVFIRYEEEKKPEVSEKNGKLEVKLIDPVIDKEVIFNPDLLVLSTGIYGDNEELSQILKLPLTEDGFFMEAHAKIRPLDFTTDGIFLAGLAHSPRTIEESIAQAKGASIRAVTILSKDKILAKAEIPTVNEKWCSGCGICEAICPYGARKINPETKIAEVIEVLCQACGACSVACPSGVSQQKGFEQKEIFVMIDTALGY